MMRRTDRQMLDRYTDSAPHTMQPVPIMYYIPENDYECLTAAVLMLKAIIFALVKANSVQKSRQFTQQWIIQSQANNCPCTVKFADISLILQHPYTSCVTPTSIVLPVHYKRHCKMFKMTYSAEKSFANGNSLINTSPKLEVSNGQFFPHKFSHDILSIPRHFQVYQTKWPPCSHRHVSTCSAVTRRDHATQHSYWINSLMTVLICQHGAASAASAVYFVQCALHKSTHQQQWVSAVSFRTK